MSALFEHAEGSMMEPVQMIEDNLTILQMADRYAQENYLDSQFDFAPSNSSFHVDGTFTPPASSTTSRRDSVITSPDSQRQCLSASLSASENNFSNGVLTPISSRSASTSRRHSIVFRDDHSYCQPAHLSGPLARRSKKVRILNVSGFTSVEDPFILNAPSLCTQSTPLVSDDSGSLGLDDDLSMTAVSFSSQPMKYWGTGDLDEDTFSAYGQPSPVDSFQFDLTTGLSAPFSGSLFDQSHGCTVPPASGCIDTMIGHKPPQTVVPSQTFNPPSTPGPTLADPFETPIKSETSTFPYNSSDTYSPCTYGWQNSSPRELKPCKLDSEDDDNDMEIRRASIGSRTKRKKARRVRNGTSRMSVRQKNSIDMEKEKGHSCPHCHYITMNGTRVPIAFFRMEHLTRHMDTVHGQKIYKCVVPQCNRQIKGRYDNYKAHYKTHFKGKSKGGASRNEFVTMKDSKALGLASIDERWDVSVEDFPLPVGFEPLDYTPDLNR